MFYIKSYQKKVLLLFVMIVMAFVGVLVIGFLTYSRGPSKEEFILHADRDKFCGTYVGQDPACAGNDGQPVAIGFEVLEGIGTTCIELNSYFNFAYKCSGSPADLTCIRSCCPKCQLNNP